jgi:hypothetical protein
MTNLNVTVFPAEPGYKFIHKTETGGFYSDVPVFAWRVKTWATDVLDNPLDSLVEPLDIFGNTVEEYEGIRHPSGYLQFCDGRGYLNWPDFRAANPDA